MSTVAIELGNIVGEKDVLTGDQVNESYGGDECLTTPHLTPPVVVRPSTTQQVAKILELANRDGVRVTVRGGATGLAGGCVPYPEAILMSLERMRSVVEIDVENQVAVVEPCVTLEQLDEATAPHALLYPIFPGESSATLGGNVATNAGGMRAVKYGVTRHQVLGLEVVLPTGRVIHTGGKFVKVSSGYDLTQLIIGSEGTLGVVTQATVKLVPRLGYRSTILAPFPSLGAVAKAVPAIVRTGVGPLMLEYIDNMTMMAVCSHAGLDLGIDPEIQSKTQAYLVIIIEGRSQDRVDEDLGLVGEVAAEHGSEECLVLPSSKASQLIAAREQGHWAGKKAGSQDVIDVVVPRAALPQYMEEVRAIAAAGGTMFPGCGHAGDGNVHLAVFERDEARREELVRELLRAGLRLGGAISAEHGIGTAKKKYLAELEDPVKLELMRGIKRTFDPNGILNPGVIFD